RDAAPARQERQGQVRERMEEHPVRGRDAVYGGKPELLDHAAAQPLQGAVEVRERRQVQHHLHTQGHPQLVAQVRSMTASFTVVESLDDQAGPKGPLISLVIPTFNEAANIAELLARLAGA